MTGTVGDGMVDDGTADGGFDPVAVAEEIEARLREAGTPEKAAKEKRYLRSDLDFLGVPVPALRRTVLAEWRFHRVTASHRDLIALARTLWAPAIHERRMAAIALLSAEASRLTSRDVAFLEELLRESRTWAYVDALAVKCVGAIIDRDAQACAVLDRWAADSDFWIRRSALLALLPGIRAGHGDLDRFGRYADAMVGEREFFIRKALGWVLREISTRDPDYVRAWVAVHGPRASGVTLREAVRRLPPQVAPR